MYPNIPPPGTRFGSARPAVEALHQYKSRSGHCKAGLNQSCATCPHRASCQKDVMRHTVGSVATMSMI